MRACYVNITWHAKKATITNVSPALGLYSRGHNGRVIIYKGQLMGMSPF